LVGLDFVEFLVVVFYDDAVSLTSRERSNHIVSSILNLILEGSRRDQVPLFLDRFEFLEDGAQFDCRLLEVVRICALRVIILQVADLPKGLG